MSTDLPRGVCPVCYVRRGRSIPLVAGTCWLCTERVELDLSMGLRPGPADSGTREPLPGEVIVDAGRTVLLDLFDDDPIDL